MAVSAALALLLPSLFGCSTTAEPDKTPAEREPVAVPSGAPIAGMAEGVFDLPVGTPMGGYSARCTYLGGASKIDNRKTPYTVTWAPSVGVHTPARAQVLWLENGEDHLVVARFDGIYSFDGFIDELEERLTAATGHDMHGRVVLAASHTHHQVANYSAQEAFFLGGDRYDEEIFLRMTADLEALALQAYDSRVPAAIGIGMAKDWDPEDHVYRDRRDQNDEHQFFDDLPAGKYKDPNLWVLRVDTAEGDPLGFFFTFGMHGTTLDDDNPLLSNDSAGGVERGVEEMFDVPLVIGHMQGGGGDASPGGRDHDLARIESLGEYGAQAIYDLWAATPTSTDPIELDVVSRAISLERDQISVERPQGALVYTPYVDDEDYTPDDVVYDENGAIITPIDEFNAPYGGVFCGYDDPLLSSGTIGSSVFPYDGCMDVELISGLVFGIFGLDVEQLIMPLPHTVRANTQATRMGGVHMRTPEGEELVDDALLAFFPGETTSVYSEQFRRRAAAEAGFEHALPVGYAQDHEGYLLVPEDWLLGGYEPNITFWGPLGAEHIMEGLLKGVEDQLLDDIVLPDEAFGDFATTTYDPQVIEAKAPPDPTPSAGAQPAHWPEELYTPLRDLGLEPEIQPPSEVARVQGVVQLVWDGGDPMVDSPYVVLERKDGGDWVEVSTRSGRAVSSDRTDILTTWHPDPLYPADAIQTHTWWAGWQAVAWGGDDRAGLPLGTYRLRVFGETAADGATEWPWDSTPYELASAEFEVVPAEVTVSAGEGTISASIVAPTYGWRLVSMEGDSRGANPLVDATLTWELSDGSTVDDASVGESAGGWTTFTTAAPDGAVAAVVTDAWGNEGRLELVAR
ncbi:MAG: hypothetical protein H6742_04595 [Alphaproteobacteria bacterium]|nr:hypothetical protein [Alphaproteobacteria bacterium]